MIQIAIIEDNRFVRDGVTLKLEEQPDLSVSYSSAHGNIGGIRDAAPQILLLDAGLEGDDSLELAARIRSELPGVRVIVMDLLPVHEDIVDFVNAGVSGFVLKDATLEDLFTTIRAVAAGQTILPPQMTSTLFSQIVEEAVLRGLTEVTEATELTTREQKVVSLIGEGLATSLLPKCSAFLPTP